MVISSIVCIVEFEMCIIYLGGEVGRVVGYKNLYNLGEKVRSGGEKRIISR